MALELERLIQSCKLKAVRVSPTREPVKQLGVGERERVIAILTIAMGFSKPRDEFPIGWRKQFLLVRRARGEINQVTQ